MHPLDRIDTLRQVLNAHCDRLVELGRLALGTNTREADRLNATQAVGVCATDLVETVVSLKATLMQIHPNPFKVL